MDEMKNRIEQDNEQYSPFALTLPRGAAYAPLPQATKAGAKVRSHRILLDETDVDAFIRLGLLKEDQRQDEEALRTAVMTLVYRAEDDLA
jgi:hypothetical protein